MEVGDGHGVVLAVLAARLLGLLAGLVLGAHLAFGVGAFLVGEDEGGVVVEGRAAKGSGKDADGGQDEAGADFDERRRVIFLRWGARRETTAPAASRRVLSLSLSKDCECWMPSDSGACFYRSQGASARRSLGALQRRGSTRTGSGLIRTGL